MDEQIDEQKLTTEKVILNVQDSFDNLRKALIIREKLLLKQYELLIQTNKIKVDTIKFLRDNENDVFNSIRQFGRFNIEHLQQNNNNNTMKTTIQQCNNTNNIINNNNYKNNQNNNNNNNDLIFKNDDYISPNIDHDFMYKCLIDQTKNITTTNTSGIEKLVTITAAGQHGHHHNYGNLLQVHQQQQQQQQDGKSDELMTIQSGSIIDFTNNHKTLIKNNANFINESIINITLNESKDLIDKTAFDNKLQLITTTPKLLQQQQNYPLFVGGVMTTKTTTAANNNFTKNLIHDNIDIDDDDDDDCDVIGDIIDDDDDIDDDEVDIDDNIGRCCHGEQNNCYKQLTKTTTSQNKKLQLSSPIKTIKNNKLIMINNNKNIDNDNNNEELSKSLKNISNLTINNCTGNIKFKNISNLTINTCKDTKYIDIIDTPTGQTTTTTTTATTATTKPDDIQCDFYKRLLTETKLIKYPVNKQQQKHHHYKQQQQQQQQLQQRNSITTINSSSDSTIESDHCNNKLMKNDIELFKMNKLNCYNNNNNKKKHDLNDDIIDHPIQVQQWLKQIIYEQETEPVQTNEFLEYSHIDVN